MEADPTERSSEAGRPVRVLCVDDNAAVAEAIRLKVSIEPNLEWVGRLDSADELVREAARTKPDIVLLDIDMPGKDPFAALEELAAASPSVRAIMLSGHIRHEYIERSMDAGAWGYAFKGEGPDAIIATIREVAAGNFSLGPQVRKHYGRVMNPGGADRA